MSRPGNRQGSPAQLPLRPGNRVAGALYSPLVVRQSVAAVQVQQASAETVVAEVVTITEGLDVNNINATLAEYNSRLEALEAPP